VRNAMRAARWCGEPSLLPATPTGPLRPPPSPLDPPRATPCQIKRLFPRVIDLPRSTVKLSHGGDLFEVTTFRGSTRGDGLASAAQDAGARAAAAQGQAAGWAGCCLRALQAAACSA
jgi:hypothetical protein